MVRPLGEMRRTVHMFYVYMLKSKSFEKTYVGCMGNFDRRLLSHNAGKCISTKACRPWIVVKVEQFDSLSEARKRERYLKSGVGRRYLKRLLL